jgi:methanogenic corrinoid protein MtbC1
MAVLDQLRQSISDYDKEQARASANQVIADDVDPVAALAAITDALTYIGDQYGCGELFLPDLIGAADAAQVAIPIIEEGITKTGAQAKRHGTVVIGTVKGDIHDIGKAMVGALLTAHGFKVIDLGTDVAVDKFMAAIQTDKTDILALSALLTTTAPQMKRVIAAVQEAGLRENIKIMVGGGALNREFADSIGVDAYGETAVEAVALAKQLLNI